MSKFNSEDFCKFIFDNNIVTFNKNPLTLNSGEISNVYINWREISNDAGLIDKLSGHILNYLDDLKIDFNCFYGVKEGMSKLALISNFKRYLLDDTRVRKYSLPMGRGKEKTHGDEKDRKFLGFPYGKTIILEDVVTTGNSLLKEIWNINGNDCQVIAAISLTDRMKPKNKDRFQKELQQLRISYHPLSNLKNLTPHS